jgi:hypothetical protein
MLTFFYLTCTLYRAHISSRRNSESLRVPPPALLYNRRGLTRSDSEFRRPEIWAQYYNMNGSSYEASKTTKSDRSWYETLDTLRPYKYNLGRLLKSVR